MTRLGDLRQLLTLAVPAGVLSAAGRITTNHAPLKLAEADALGSVTRFRRYAYVTSRQLAQDLLSELGVDDFIVGHGCDGAPIWPTGLCGSISYKKEWSAVVVAKLPTFSSLGVDIESFKDIRGNAWEDILSPNELQYISRLANLPGSKLVNLGFNVKEAYFKAQYPITRNSELEFRDIELVPDLNGQLSLSPIPSSLNVVVRLKWSEHWCVAVVGLLREDVGQSHNYV